MGFVAEVRQEVGRPQVTLILVHHENKGGSVSGAWEGAGDTLLHVESRGNGYTAVRVEKARWASAAHDTTLDLAWTDGEGFRVKEERDLFAEMVEAIDDDGWHTIDEIRELVGAGKTSVREIVEKEQADRFEMRTGEDARALGRSPRSKLYRIRG